MTDTLEILAGNEKIQITENHLHLGMQFLRANLEPGMPVFLENNSNASYLFFSDGTLNEKQFSVQRGRTGYIFIPNRCTKALIMEEPVHENGLIKFPQIGEKRTYRIILGEDGISRSYEETLNMLKFVHDAYNFILDDSYISDNSHIPKSIESAVKRRIEASFELIPLTAVVNIMADAYQEVYGEACEIQAQQLSEREHTLATKLDEGYPVDKDDYFLEKKPEPSGIIGFVRLGIGSSVGEVFVIPNRGNEDVPPYRELDDVFELAFSLETINKFYPYGAMRSLRLLDHNRVEPNN